MLPYQYLKPWAERDGNTASSINPATINLRLGNKIRVPMWYWNNPLTRSIAWQLKQRNFPIRLWSDQQVFDKYTLWPGDFVLCHSDEFTTVPDDAVALLFSRSSTGRIGLEHLHCVSAETKVDGPDFKGGSQYIINLVNEPPFRVYAFDERTNKWIITTATAHKAKPNTNVILVEYEFTIQRNYRKWTSIGEIYCTPDHKFRAKDGNWIEAKYLPHEIQLTTRYGVCTVQNICDKPFLEDTYDLNVPIYENFSSDGICIHNSGLGDPGFKGQWTWELQNVAPWPIVLEAGKELMQVCLIRTTEVPDVLYGAVGHYQGQLGANPSYSDK